MFYSKQTPRFPIICLERQQRRRRASRFIEGAPGYEAERPREKFFYVARFSLEYLTPTAPMGACCLGPRRNPARWLRISSWCLHAGQPIERIRAGITPCSLPLRSQFCRPVVPGLLRKLIFLTYVAHATRANRSSVGSGARMSSLQR